LREIIFEEYTMEDLLEPTFYNSFTMMKLHMQRIYTIDTIEECKEFIEDLIENKDNVRIVKSYGLDYYRTGLRPYDREVDCINYWKNYYMIDLNYTRDLAKISFRELIPATYTRLMMFSMETHRDMYFDIIKRLIKQ